MKEKRKDKSIPTPLDSKYEAVKATTNVRTDAATNNNLK